MKLALKLALWAVHAVLIWICVRLFPDATVGMFVLGFSLGYMTRDVDASEDAGLLGRGKGRG